MSEHEQVKTDRKARSPTLAILTPWPGSPNPVDLCERNEEVFDTRGMGMSIPPYGIHPPRAMQF
ncbi:MAG: hypothetical protein AB1733_19770 [Thermodesulfobacteriota bacterium]